MRILFRKKIFREGKYNSEEEKENEREIGRRVQYILFAMENKI